MTESDRCADAGRSQACVRRSDRAGFCHRRLYRGARGCACGRATTAQVGRNAGSSMAWGDATGPTNDVRERQSSRETTDRQHTAAVQPVHLLPVTFSSIIPSGHWCTRSGGGQSVRPCRAANVVRGKIRVCLVGGYGAAVSRWTPRPAGRSWLAKCVDAHDEDSA